MLVADSVALTVAFGTAAPDGSVTTPLMEPRKVCALAGTADKTTNKSTKTAKCFIFSFPPQTLSFGRHQDCAVRRCTTPHDLPRKIERDEPPASVSALLLVTCRLVRMRGLGVARNVPAGVGRNVALFLAWEGTPREPIWPLNSCQTRGSAVGVVQRKFCVGLTQVPKKWPGLPHNRARRSLGFAFI